MQVTGRGVVPDRSEGRAPTPRGIRDWIRADYPFLAIAAALLIPLIWTAASQIRDHWWPVNDDALMGLSVRDVLTGHPPVMGPRTTSSNGTGIETHHPGPIVSYLLSLPVAVFDFRPTGLVLACALWSGITVVAILWVARRLGGIPYVVCSALAVAAIWWALGVQMSVRPFNPYFGVLPVLLMALLAWGLLRRDLALMPWFAVTGSVMIQSHLSYAVFVPVVSLPVLIVGLVRWYRARSVIWPFRGWAGLKVCWWRRRGLWTTVAVPLIWLPSMIELFTYHPNNLTQVFRYTIADSRGASVGLLHATEVTLRMLLPAPGGYQSLGLNDGLGSLAGTGPDARLLFGAVVVALLVGAGWFFPRAVMVPRGRTLQVGARIALVWLAAAVLVVASLPVKGQAGEGWNYLQLWPAVVTAWLATALVIGSVLRNAMAWLPDRLLPPARRVVAAATAHRTQACWTAFVISAMAVVATPLASPVSSPRTHGEQYAVVVNRLHSMIRSTGPPPDVRFDGSNVGAGYEVAPALAYGLVLRGDHIYLPAVWIGAEDTDFRKYTHAPSDAVPVHVEQLPAGQGTAPSATPYGALVGIVEGTSGAYFAVYAVL